MNCDRIHARLERIGDTRLGTNGLGGLPSGSVMSRPWFPILLSLSAASPSAALALGLGDLHVESALGQDFVAHIDLIDASPDDLARLSAAIADDDVFARSHLERPPFLFGTTVAVGQDANGKPILRLRSTQSFTEPVVTFLVDVRWRGGELIREYSAFLDPAGLALNASDAEQPAGVGASAATNAPATLATAPAPPTNAPAAEATPAPALAPAAPVTPVTAPAPTTTPVTQKVPAAVAPKRTSTTPDDKPRVLTHTVASGDTLARIASIAGARSGTQRHRMMIAIYRANPAAFQTNFNALHRGVVLRIPSSAELAAISPADAEHEYRAQLAAWSAMNPRRSHTRHAATASVGATGGSAAARNSVAVRNSAAISGSSAPPHSAVDSKADLGSAEADRLALARRVESLEQSLQAVRRELQQRTEQAALPVRAPQPSTSAAAAKDVDSTQDSPLPWYRRAPFIALTSALVVMLAGGAWWTFRRRNEDDPRVVQQAAPDSSVAEQPKVDVPAETPTAELPTAEPVPEEPLASDNSVEAQAEPPVASSPPAPAAVVSPELTEEIDAGATTAILGPEFAAPGDTVEHRFSFYNPESLADTMHVVVGSELTRPLAFVERRKNPAIVLQQAIEREPSRSDLHLKLLELYYATASENRLAFLEAARQITQKKGLLSAEDWARIADMGRQIAPDDELFASNLDDQAVA